MGACGVVPGDVNPQVAPGTHGYANALGQHVALRFGPGSQYSLGRGIHQLPAVEVDHDHVVNYPLGQNVALTIHGLKVKASQPPFYGPGEMVHRRIVPCSRVVVGVLAGPVGEVERPDGEDDLLGGGVDRDFESGAVGRRHDAGAGGHLRADGHLNESQQSCHYHDRDSGNSWWCVTDPMSREGRRRMDWYKLEIDSLATLRGS